MSKRLGRGSPVDAKPLEAVSAQLLTFERFDLPIRNSCGALDIDVDYDYTLLAGIGHLDGIVSSEDCCRLCRGEQTCKAYTWVQNLYGNPGQCWLKGGFFKGVTQKKGVISAITRDPAAA